MSINYDRPFLNLDEQINHLRRKNVYFSDESFVRETLINNSYYTIVNGYKDLFPVCLDKDGIEIFTNPVKFDQLYTLYIIDNNLNSILFKNIIYIEKILRSQISYHVSDRFGVSENEYLDFKKYSRRNGLDRKLVIENIENKIHGSVRNASVKHYNNHHNHIPPWVAVNELYFGTMINWYKILPSEMKSKIVSKVFHKTPINSDISQCKTLFADMLSLLQTYRNNIAHGNRTFKSNVRNELPKREILNATPNSVLNKDEFYLGYGKNDLYAVFLCIGLLINDPYILENFHKDLLHLFQPYIENNLTLSSKGNIYKTLELPDNLFFRLDEIIKIK